MSKRNRKAEAEAVETIEQAVDAIEHAEQVVDQAVESVVEGCENTVEQELTDAKAELEQLAARMKYLRELIATLSGQAPDQETSKIAKGRIIYSEMNGSKRKDVIERFMTQLNVGKAYASTMYALVKAGK